MTPALMSSPVSVPMMRRESSSVWTPASIPGLALWMDPSTGITYGTPPAFSLWTPAYQYLPGAMAQATADLQQKTSTIGSAAAITGDTDDKSNWTGPASDFKFLSDGSPVSVIMMMEQLPSTAAYILSTTSSTGTSGIGLLIYMTAASSLVVRCPNGSGYYFNNSSMSTTGAAFVMSIRYPIDGRIYIRKDSVPVTNFALGTPSASDPNRPMMLGFGAVSNFAGSKLSQMCLYNDTISNADEELLVAWMRAKL